MTLDALDMSLSPALAASGLNVLAFPLYLMAVARIPALAHRHARQFTWTAVFTVAVQAALFCLPSLRPASWIEWLVALFLTAGALTFYLEVWALMTRGYTLGILLTMLGSANTLTAQQIFDGYRGGDGLGWIMRHRLGGLETTGFVHRDGETLVLSGGRGMFIARLYRLSIAVLGLRKTG